jgi:ribosomal-protein-alanine N-acetyltransferase
MDGRVMQPSGEHTSSPSIITVRPLLPSDSSFVLTILKESPEASMWSEASILESASHEIALAAEVNGRVAGVLIGRIAADEFEIFNLAVEKASRRRGIAAQLVSVALHSAWKQGALRSYLEVRASNTSGLALYSGLGFQVCGRRPNYYWNPPEDAMLLVLHRNGTNS